MTLRTSSTQRVFSVPSRKMARILLLLTISYLVAFVLADDEPDARIVGGDDADLHEYPWFASWGSSCGATLIHDDILLTAAHCDPVITNQVVVGAYEKNKYSDNSVVRYVKQRIIHPQWGGTETWNNDVMLLKLSVPVTNVRKIKINSDPQVPAVLDTVTPIGLGRMEEVDGDFPEVLQEVDVRVIESEKCNSSPMYENWIQDTMICAGVSGGGMDACFGDSGGPLLKKDFVTGEMLQVGVVSFGTGCARPNKPGVYHRISSSYDWIQQQICRHSDVKPSTCPGASTQPPATTTNTTSAVTKSATTGDNTTNNETTSDSESDGEETAIVEQVQAVSLFTHPENPPPSLLGMCEGDCDRDSDCADGYFCFFKTEGVAQTVPGCAGSDSTSTDFCVLERYRNHGAKTSPVRQSIFNTSTSRTGLRGSRTRKNGPRGRTGRTSGILAGAFHESLP